MSAAPLPPIRRQVRVPWTPDAAFRRFTRDIGSWWPTSSHSVGGRDVEAVVFEEGMGGRIYERIRGGREAEWGRVTAWDPPRHVAFTWYPGRGPEQATDVSLRFVPDGTGTRLELVHSGWERLGSLARTARRGYPLGWTFVLRHWADRHHTPLVWGLAALGRVLMPVMKLLSRRAAKAAQVA